MTTRPLTETEIAKRDDQEAREASEQAARRERKRLRRALDALEEAEVLKPSPDTVTLARVAVARRLLHAGRIPPEVLMRTLGI